MSQLAETMLDEIIRKFSDAVNRHDVDAICDLYSEDVVIFGPQHPEEGTKGRTSLKKQYEVFFKAFPNLQIKVSNLVVTHNVAWFAWEAAGAHTGILQTPVGP